MMGKPFSEKTAQIIDEEISKMIEAAYIRAKNLLIENREKLNQLAGILLQKEVIFREDLETIFGARPFDDHEHVALNGNDTPELPAASVEVIDETRLPSEQPPPPPGAIL